MTAEEKKSALSQNLSAALKPVKIENPANVDAVTRQEVQKKSLAELKVEIKFHLNQMAGHVIEIGKLLIEAKEQVGHGEWYNWLEENFNLKKSMANNFMNCAMRFGNLQSIGDLKPTQMMAMLALPAGEEEKFIEAKAAEGNPVEDMTVKNLKAEIADWKKKLVEVEQERDGYKTANEIAEAQLEDASKQHMQMVKSYGEEQERLNNLLNENLDLQEKQNELQEKYDEVQNELLREKSNVKTTTVEVPPADYAPTKKALEEIKAENEKLQAKLKEFQERPIEVAVEKPADYEAVKAELASLKEQQKNLSTDYAVTKRLDEIVNVWQIISGYAAKNTAYVKKHLPKFKAIAEQMLKDCDLWEKQQSDKTGDRRVVQKLDYHTFQGLIEKIRNGQRDFIDSVQLSAVELLGAKIPESVFDSDDPHTAFAVWLGREINPVVVNGDYKEEIRVVGDKYDWFTVK